MAQTATQKLDAGDPFPSTTIRLLDGSSVTLPNGQGAEHTVLLIYRGKW